MLVEAGLLVLAYRVGLACLPSALMLRRGESTVRELPLAASTVAALRAELGWAMGVAGRRVPGARCLAQSLAAHHLFARHGLSSMVRFGGRKKPDGTFDAHAWLESGGQVVYGNAYPELFTPIVSSAAAPSTPPGEHRSP